MDLTLRQAMMDDIEMCSSLGKNSLIYERYFDEEGSFTKSVRRGIENGQLYVAITRQGEIAGLIKVLQKGFCGLYPYLALISVGEEYRGGGVGSFLLSAFEQMGIEAGARKVALMVSDFNHDAKKLYERRGYRTIGLIPDAAKDGIGEYLMLKDLSQGAPL